MMWNVYLKWCILPGFQKETVDNFNLKATKIVHIFIAYILAVIETSDSTY